jgi:DNA polymerase-1
MLRGTITHKATGFSYKVYGMDTAGSLNLRISSQKFNAICLMSNPDCVELGNELWERGIKISTAKIDVETEHHTDATTGKIVKSPINQEFFCQLGAILRYLKVHCTTRNIDGFTGLQLASGEFEPEEYTSFTIPTEDGSDTLATVKLRLGNIYEMKCESPLFSIDIVNDPLLDNELYPSFKNGISKGFANTIEYLGFEVQKQTVFASNALGGMYSSLDEVIEAHPEKEFEWLRGKDYKIVTDEMLEEVCEYIYNYDGYVYYDTETTGLRINFKSRIGQADQCVGIILSVIDGESFFFPMQMKAIKNLCGGDHFFFMEHYMRKILEGKELVAHNMVFDWKVSYIYDINANIVHDTLAIFRLTIGAERKDLSVGLKELTEMLLHRDALELSDLVIDDSWGESDVRFWDLPEELVKYYACADTDDTRGIFKYAMQNDLLTKYNAHKTYEIEIAFSFAVAYQEFYGHLFDVNKTEKLRTEIMGNIDRLYKEMCGIIGHEFNPNSSPQLLKILYKELGIPEQISRKTGRPTTDKETLKKLGELTDIDGNIKYPFVQLLLEYRVNEGVRKIIDKFPEVATQDGYLFPGVKQYGTTTGRVSIKEPNYQSYNNPVKKEIIPRPGYYMFDTDYSSVEYRVLGNMSGNKMIKDSFYDPDFDYHSYQAARMYGVPYSSVTGKLRKAAKGINFGLPYGMGDESLGVRIFGEKSDENTRKASALRKSYFKGQEDIEVFFQNARENGASNGYTETYFGRRRYYNRAQYSINSIKRQAGNHVIQGTAADVYKLAVGRVFKRICREGWLGKVLLTGFIHDELLGEVSVDIDPMKWLKVLREEFEVKITDEKGNQWCPLYMGFGWGRNWYEAKSTEIPIKLQWEFVEKYGETGFPSWNGDVSAFCDSVPDMLRVFEIEDCSRQLLSEEAQCKEIKPALNSSILGVIKEDAKHYKEVLENEDLRSVYHIQGTITDSEGNIITDVPKTSDTQEAIDYFCMLHNVDRSKVNALSIADVDIKESTNALGGTDYDDGEESEEEQTRQQLERLINDRIQTLGLYVDYENKEISCLMLPSSWLQLIKQHTVPKDTDNTACNLIFIDYKNKQKYTTQVAVPTKEIMSIQSIYMTYFKS